LGIVTFEKKQQAFHTELGLIDQMSVGFFKSLAEMLMKLYTVAGVFESSRFGVVPEPTPIPPFFDP
jgi:hypothetical protein